MPYLIQGQSPPLPRDPVLLESVTYVPVQDIVTVLGGDWEEGEDDAESVATIATWSARLQPDSPIVRVNDLEVCLEAPVIRKDGTLWVPADFFHQAFGYEIETNGETVHVSNPDADPEDAE